MKKKIENKNAKKKYNTSGISRGKLGGLFLTDRIEEIPGLLRKAIENEKYLNCKNGGCAGKFFINVTISALFIELRQI
jgi:hypothetical protein